MSFLTTRALSDYVGRRPVILTAMALQTVAILPFLIASGVATLMLARIIRGVATGVAASVLGAGLLAASSYPCPAQARSALILSSPINVAVWSMNGFCLSLGPTLARSVTGWQAPLTGALQVFVL